MRYVVYDVETRGIIDLKQHGSHIYTCDPATDVWCVSYCIVADGGRGPIQTWVPSDPVPLGILSAAADPETLIVAFNDAFERQIEAHILHPRYGWPIFPLERRRCAQAIALSYALPASLEKVAAALKLKSAKTLTGVMKLLAKPRKARKGEDPTQIYWHDEPERLNALYEYNRCDVGLTVEIVRLLGFIPPQEQKVWELDAAINTRGICCDVELLDAALRLGEQAAVELQEKITAHTDGEITSPAQTARIQKWLGQRGCGVSNIQEETLLGALKRPDLNAEARQLIKLRLDGAQTAVSRLATMRNWVGADHRIRQVFRYHGAMPGRFTSFGVQVQNLKKPTIDDTTAAIAAVRTGNLPHLQTRYERPLGVIGDIARGLIIPALGHQLFIADLSGIESRGLAWLANEESKLAAWQEFDRTKQAELEPYRLLAREFGFQGDNARNLSKTADLAFQYQGSIGAWRRLAPEDDKTSDEEVRRFRNAWMHRHPNIEKFWRTSVRQAGNAIEHPGEHFTVARIAFIREGLFLHMELPSGRRIRYPYARIYADERSKSFTFRDAGGGRWEWYHVLKQGRGVFGGLIAENATQALCRDIFVEAMLRLEAAGYHIVAHLHDEFVCEVPNDFGSLEEFRSIIVTPPAWALDFPIATKARIADRFIESKTVKVIEVDEIAELKPVTPADIAAINAGLGSWGIKPISLGAAATPPHERAEPGPKQAPPSGNGHDDYTFETRPHGATAIRYVYKDARGLLFMRVTRTNNHTFPTQHWQDGHWTNGWPPTVIPYRLPELLAVPAAEPVWICEGEKDADNVAALGLIATTNPGGAKVWQAELSQWFKDKQLVYILEDNDEPGRGHSRKILAALSGVVPNIATISFLELPEKGDVSDWLAAGGNKQLLLARAEQALKQSKELHAYIATDLSRVQPRAIRWLWPKHLARGALELLAGLPTVGKSQIQCQYVACATTGRDWPNGAPGIIPCRVIMLTAEDNTDDTLVPRLIAAGADLTRIKELKAIRRNGKEELFLLGEDLAVLEQMIHDWGDVGLVTIDPITAYMGHAKHFDSHRATDVRSQLSPLKTLAERTGVAISAVTHPPKNVGQRALDHFIGSQAFIAAARLGHLCIEEMAEDAEGGRQLSGRYLFTDAKPSIKARQPTLTYRIGVVETAYTDPDSGLPIEAPVIRWEGESDLSADEAITASRPSKGRGPGARDFLLDILAGGPVLQKTVIERGANRGLSYDQLWRAKKTLGVEDFRGKGVKAGPSHWALPQHVPADAEKA